MGKFRLFGEKGQKRRCRSKQIHQKESSEKEASQKGREEGEH